MKRQSREKARALRLEGKPITEIAALVGVAKSSVFQWTRDLPVPEQLTDEHRAAAAEARHAHLEARRAARKALLDASPKADYSKQWWKDHYKRRKEKLVSRLGGRCVGCGSTQDLEFHHIDPSTKVSNVTDVLPYCVDGQHRRSRSSSANSDADHAIAS